jgi:hypothetical protein
MACDFMRRAALKNLLQPFDESSRFARQPLLNQYIVMIRYHMR